jgi:hypothetical protein
MDKKDLEEDTQVPEGASYTSGFGEGSVGGCGWLVTEKVVCPALSGAAEGPASACTLSVENWVGDTIGLG